MIYYEPKLLFDIRSTIDTTIKISKDNNEDVLFKFNTKLILVNQYSRKEDIYNLYHNSNQILITDVEQLTF